jgi:hypothetical protein
MKKHSAPASGWLSVYSGQTFLGTILSRGRQGYEARNSNDELIGTHATREAAIAAVSAAAMKGAS